STKALQISKLYADITYSHRLRSNDISDTYIEIDSIESNNANIEMSLDSANNPSSENANTNESSKNKSSENRKIVESLDEKSNSKDINDKEDFDNYLQEWINILEEERQ
ncbi:16187_t:CDS:1, partial [Cetraspora pellucida]